MIRNLFAKYRSILLYGVFGVLTTAINFGAYAILYERLGLTNVASNIISWALAVAFAFITNKLWVYESKSLRAEDLLPELWKFVSCRLATGLVDLGIMYVSVDILKAPALPWKIISNTIVIILNFTAGKALVFNKKHR